jgi:sulfite exporter TauE/SafE
MIEPLAGLMLGLAGSLHCIGMCGPIAIALPGQKAKRTITWSMSRDKLLYQFGRVTTYSALGVVAGLSGSALVDAGFSQQLSVAAGVLMIVTAVTQLVWHTPLVPAKMTGKLSNVVERAIGRRLSSDRNTFAKGGTGAHYLIGIFNGLLPCGLVVSALIGSIGTGDVLQGSMFMAMFGLGTVPLMSVVAILGGVISCQLRHKLRSVTPVIAIVIGVAFILRGLSLDIPFVSPVLGGPTPSCCTTH